MRYSNHAKLLFEQNGFPTPHLRRIFVHLGVPITTLTQANEFAQKNLLRTPGSERWDPQAEKPIIQTIRKHEALLWKDLQALGMMDEIVPTQKSYDYAVLMGGIKKDVLMRLAQLIELEQQGCRFGTVVLLAGARLLRDVEKEGLPVDITTEAHMMVYIYEHHYQAPVNQKILLASAPAIQKEDGSVVPPTTDSTLVYFAKVAPHDGSCLVVSNQPYVARQTLVAQRILDQSRFPTEGTGKGVAEVTGGIVMFMDEFARTLYELSF